MLPKFAYTDYGKEGCADSRIFVTEILAQVTVKDGYSQIVDRKNLQRAPKEQKKMSLGEGGRGLCKKPAKCVMEWEEWRIKNFLF